MKINKNITTVNRWIGRDGCAVEWIVLHYTANPCTHGPDLAVNEAAYFRDVYRGASAHFFVDDTSVWQSVELADTAWHCGDNPPPLNGCTNRTSIGVEMCNKYDAKTGVYTITEKTTERTVALVRWLLKKYPAARLCRHYDVTGKICPQPWVSAPVLWENFKDKVKEEPMTAAEKKAFQDLRKEVASLKKELNKVNARTKVAIDSEDEAPDWAAPTIRKLVKCGALRGDRTGLALTNDMARLLVINDREGLYK